jgi:SAM-dependent methyltransferase
MPIQTFTPKIAQVFQKPIKVQRQKLFDEFSKNFILTKETVCIDLGGVSPGFEQLGNITDAIAVNIRIKNKIKGWSYIKADARCLPLQDKSIDIVFSNALLEHIKEGKERAVNQMKRVSKGNCFVSVPYLYSPIEPHFLVPGFQFLPEFIKKLIIFKFGIRIGHIGKENYYDQGTFTTKEFRNLFPKATLKHLKMYGCIFNLIALQKN